MLRLLAPAKINLCLEVIGRRSDGYHEIKSIIQAIDLADELFFEPADRLAISADTPGWRAEHSLVSKAARLLQGRTGTSLGARVRLTKRIPLVSGLGGDSSDGAAALKGFNRLWHLGLSDAELMEIGAALGSDVPFFFCGGTVMVEGRGELLAPLRPYPGSWVVILLPPLRVEGGKTARLYASLRPEDFSDGSLTEEFARLLMEGREVPPEMFHNTFERAVFALWPDIGRYRWRFIEAGATRVFLSGAGPSLFSLHADCSEAERIAANLEEQGLKSFLARTVGHLE